MKKRIRPASEWKQKAFYSSILGNMRDILKDLEEGVITFKAADEWKIRNIDWIIGEYQRNFFSDKWYAFFVFAFIPNPSLPRTKAVLLGYDSS